jgi:hypothetical protein
MIRTSKAPVPWPVPWKKGQCFFFRPGGVIERGEMEAELSGELLAPRVFPFQVDEALERGLRAVLTDESDIAAILDLVAAEREAAEAGEELSEDDRAALQEARAQVAQLYPPYRQLVRKAERRKELTPIAAFRRYCAGWEGEGLPEYRKALDGSVPDDLLEEVEPLIIQASGLFAYNLQYGRGQEKNSKAPSSSDASPEASSSDESKGVGEPESSSGEKKKTRSSSSRRGRSRSSTSGSSAGG